MSDAQSLSHGGKHAVSYRGRYEGPLVDKAVELMEAALAGVEPPAEDREFTIWVCPACGYYDADPILRRHEPMSCFACVQRAMKEWEKETRMFKSYGSAYRNAFSDCAPLMVETKVRAR